MRIVRRHSIAALAATVAACMMLLSVGIQHGHAQAVVDIDNVVIVLDASGSMNESMPRDTRSKMQVAREALLTVVQKLPPDTRVGVVAFSGSNKSSDWLHPLAPLDIDQLQEALIRLGPSGGTPLGRYIKIAADRLLEQRQEQGGYGTYRLIIVTDGAAGDSDLVQRYTPDVLSRGVTVQVIGVAMDQAHMLANSVHAYRPANDAASLDAALTAAVAEVKVNDSDAAGEDDFAVIAPLPSESASALLGALRVSGNEPIGSGRSAAPAPRPVQNQSAPVSVSNSPSPQSLITGVFSGCIWALVIAVVVVVILTKVIANATRN